MRNVFIITVLLALSRALSAQQPGTHADVNPVAEGEIKALEMKLAELIVRGDWMNTKNILHPITCSPGITGLSKARTRRW